MQRLLVALGVLVACEPRPAGPSASARTASLSASISAPASASAPPAASASAPAARVTVEDAKAKIDSWIMLNALEDRAVHDVLKDEPFRVDMFNDDEQGRIAGTFWVERVAVDLDRDGKWDEKWHRKLVGGKLVTTRELALADDESYTERYVEDAEGRWQKAP